MTETTWESVCKCGLKVRHYHNCTSCDSLRAALAAKETLVAEVERLQANEVVIADERFDMERRLTARAEKAEAVLCRAREAIQSFLSCAVDRPDKEYGTLYGVTWDQIEELKAALSSTGPCPHELELKKLRGCE